MPSPRLLVIEGNSPQTLAEHIAVGGTAAHQGYSNLLRELMPGSIVDICHPGDPAATLPDGESLAGYDGIAITGSSLHIYNGGAEVMRQIELVRSALSTGTPLFGSCWGLQVITAAAGGSVRKNPKGREIGFGRGIRLTEAGRKHPMYVGKLDVFNAPTVHLDEVETIAPGTTVLATNEVSDVQLLQGDLAQAWREGNREYATVAMRFSMVYVTRDASGRVIDGSLMEHVTATELWTFVRSSGGQWILSAIQQTR